MDAGEVYSGGIIIPPYSTEAKQRNPLARGYNFAREFLADNPLLTMLFIVTSCSLLTGAVALNVYGPLTFALFYVPVYAVCGTFLACLALRAMKPLANPLRNGIAKFMRRDDTSGFNEETYNRVLSSLRAMGAKKPRKVLHENRSNSQAYSLVYDKVRIAAWDGDFNSPKTKHYCSPSRHADLSRSSRSKPCGSDHCDG